jgi:hypothetical protein
MGDLLFGSDDPGRPGGLHILALGGNRARLIFSHELDEDYLEGGQAFPIRVCVYSLVAHR